MKIGLMLFVANTREGNRKRPYDAIRAVAQQAEADGFDSLCLPEQQAKRLAGSGSVGRCSPRSRKRPPKWISAP